MPVIKAGTRNGGNIKGADHGMLMGNHHVQADGSGRSLTGPWGSHGPSPSVER